MRPPNPLSNFAGLLRLPHELDEFGCYDDVEIAGVIVRFRLILPGTFMMGSPNIEGQRYDDDERQHEVTLTKPFWLADTPVTQALWQAVMGENPSHFRGAVLPPTPPRRS